MVIRHRKCYPLYVNFTAPLNIRIREINPASTAEKTLVATRMRETLIEVLGEERGTTLYSMDWLTSRVRWHLDPKQTTAKIFLIEDETAQIVAHAIARIEHDENQSPYGYFSTIFVDPNSRRIGLATSLLTHVESWFVEQKMPKIIYNTAENHLKLIRLFERQGYQITHRESEMVQLTKEITVSHTNLTES